MFTSLMMELFAQTHSICLIYQAQRGFLLFLTVNLGKALHSYLILALIGVAELYFLHALKTI